MNKGNFILKNTILILFIFVACNVKGQIIEVDTTNIQEVAIDAEEIHSPKKAALYSTLLPGLGQAYNKKYWKIPIIYIGFGTIGYFMGWHNENYKTHKQAYNDFTDGDDSTNSYLDLEGAKYYDLTDPTQQNNFKTSLNKAQNYYRRNRDLLFIGMIGFYGLNIIDASVDAHLFNFDISEDLSLNWQPTMSPRNNQMIYGVNCTFNF